MPTSPRPAFAAKRKALQSQILEQVALFDRLADPLIQITGRKGRIKWANRSAQALFGDARPSHTLIDRRLTQVFVSKALKTALKSLRKGERREAELIIRPDNLNHREFRVRLVRLEQKTVYGARTLVALSDVTEVLRLQAQRADFVANASHELKTPVAALSGFIETLERDPAALTAFLPLMAQEAGRMRALIDDLLRLTKTEMETANPPKAWVHIAPLIDQSISSLEFVFQDNQQTLTYTPPQPPVQVRADPSALITVFTNLLQNAAKYAPTGSEIRVTADMQGPELHIHIKNAGKGIAAQHIPRLTERFYRVDNGRAPQQGGTGLGLAIVKHILIRHEGRLLITSAPDQGACFTVALPVRRVED